MNHVLKLKEGYERYEDCEFGIGGSYWTKAICSCGWKGPERDGNRAEEEAKSDGFDHMTKKGKN